MDMPLEFTFRHEQRDMITGNLMSRVTVETKAETWHEAIDRFIEFLRGIGFFVEPKDVGDYYYDPEDAA